MTGATYRVPLFNLLMLVAFVGLMIVLLLQPQSGRDLILPLVITLLGAFIPVRSA